MMMPSLSCERLYEEEDMWEHEGPFYRPGLSPHRDYLDWKEGVKEEPPFIEEQEQAEFIAWQIQTGIYYKLPEA